MCLQREGNLQSRREEDLINVVLHRDAEDLVDEPGVFEPGDGYFKVFCPATFTDGSVDGLLVLFGEE